MTDDLEKVLKDMQSTLDEIKAILILTNQNKLEEAKKRLLPENSVKKKVYDLCDGTKTAIEIARAMNKEVNYIHAFLSILRRQGLIRSIEREGKVFYEQIF